MSWTRASWTPALCAAFQAGLRPIGPLIADQHGRRGAWPAGGAPRGGLGDPAAPLPPGPPARPRAFLSAPPRGDHEASNDPPFGRGSGTTPAAHPGAGEAVACR
jgi:hypothetical protein